MRAKSLLSRRRNVGIKSSLKVRELTEELVNVFSYFTTTHSPTHCLDLLEVLVSSHPWLGSGNIICLKAESRVAELIELTTVVSSREEGIEGPTATGQRLTMGKSFGTKVLCFARFHLSDILHS